jgi:hypothetical protein
LASLWSGDLKDVVVDLNRLVSNGDLFSAQVALLIAEQKKAKEFNCLLIKALAFDVSDVQVLKKIALNFGNTQDGLCEITLETLKVSIANYESVGRLDGDFWFVKSLVAEKLGDIEFAYSYQKNAVDFGLENLASHKLRLADLARVSGKKYELCITLLRDAVLGKAEREWGFAVFTALHQECTSEKIMKNWNIFLNQSGVERKS